MRGLFAIKRAVVVGLVGWVWVFFATPLQAAYCSLRDPVLAINTLYSGATTHRSVVKTITGKTRNAIAQRLPFTLHFNELGRHTIYVAYYQDKPLGFVHARSELSDWGLIEIAWALTPDLTIDDFFFQRCRSPECSESLRQRVLADIKGQSLDNILALMDKSANALVPELAQKYKGESELVLSLLRSALKTIAATQYGWPNTVLNAQRIDFLNSALKRNDMHVRVRPLREAGEQYWATLLDDSIVDTKTINMFDIYAGSQEIARLAQAHWRHHGRTGVFQWVFSGDREVLAIRFSGIKPEPSMEEAFIQLVGHRLPSIENCASASQVVGVALYHSLYHK